MFFGALFGQDRIFMYACDPKEAGVGFYDSFGFCSYPRLLEQLEIVLLAVGERGANYLPAALVHDNLRFQRMPLFLAGIP